MANDRVRRERSINMEKNLIWKIPAKKLEDNKLFKLWNKAENKANM